MALGSNNGGDTVTLNPVALRLDGKSDKPQFKILRKDGAGKYQLTNETVTNITGKLVGINVEKGEYNGDVTYQLTVTLKDEEVGEIYFLNINLGSSMGRSFGNALASLESVSGQDAQFFVYTNKGGYKSAGIKINDNGLSFAKSFKDELPQAKVVEFGGKTLRDYTELNNALFDLLERFNSEKVVAEDTNSNPALDEVSLEDVPF